MNGQPWEFVIVRDERTRAALAALKNKYCPPSKAAYPADFLREAPVVIVVCVKEARSFGRDVENGVLAAAHIMLGAPALGLGTVYLSAHTGDAPGLREEIRALLAAPAGITPVSIIPVGYPDDNPPAKALRPVQEMIHLERFRAAP
jgi:nitroreductase